MARVVDVIEAINGAGTMVKKRICILDSPSAADACEMKLTIQIATTISNVTSIVATEASQLYDAIATSGLREKAVNVLVAAIDEQLLETAGDTGATSTLTQNLLNPEAWMPERLRNTFDGPRASLNVKCQALAYVLTLCGCNHPHEQTYKWWYAAVVAKHFTQGWPSARTVFEHYEYLKSLVSTSRKTWPFLTIYKYPKTPHQLSDSALKHIYGDEVPTTVEIPNLVHVAQHRIPLRKNSKLLLQDAKSQQPSNRDRDAGAFLAAKSETSLSSEASASQHRCTLEDNTSDAPQWAADLKGILQAPDGELESSGSVASLKNSGCIRCGSVMRAGRAEPDVGCRASRHAQG